MNKHVMRSKGNVFVAAVVAVALLALAGCAAMLAESKYKDEAAAKYVFAVPAERLMDETAAYLNGGAFGAALAGTVVEVDREHLTAAGPWKTGKLLRSRTAARITKVDDSHSTLVMNNETQTMESKTGDWGKSAFSRTSAYEIEMIRRLDPQAAAEIEAGAKQAAEQAKK